MTAQDRQTGEIPTVHQRLETCATQFDIFRLLREVTETYGFQYFVVVGTPDTETGSFSEAVVITSVPSEIVQSYAAEGLITCNPIADALRDTGAPFEYRIDSPRNLPSSKFRTFAQTVASKYDQNCWFIVPVYHPDHGPAAVCFLGKRSPLSFSETAELTLYGHLAHNKLRQVSAKPEKADSPLTVREHECLIWTSRGKTSIEIAKILDLSEHTVNHYLNNAARKFDAVNRTQAVAYALRVGFIQ